MLDHATIAGFVCETAALRSIAVYGTQAYDALVDQEKVLRLQLAMTPEHHQAVAVWRGRVRANQMRKRVESGPGAAA